ncbi:hypothetical protein HYPSUDRAFT_101920, partial [Hypholoma sublateritium FD-334 SS-4]
WVDDILDPSETDALCGVYYVYTGRGSQTATKSWWPPIDLWDSIVRQSSWSNRSEDFYSGRLQELSNGNAVPLTSSQWRIRIKAFAVVRRASINNATISSAFLK